MTVYPPADTPRLVGKASTAVQTLISGTATVGGSSGTFGSWVLLTTATPVEYLATYVVGAIAANTIDAGSTVLIDVGLDGSTALASVALPGGSSGGALSWPGAGAPLVVPLRIPAGNDIYARVAVIGTTFTAQIRVHVALAPWAAIEGN